MTGNTLGWVIVAFVLYLLMMIAIGAFYAKGNNNSEDYFLGGRKLNGFVAALSAQASDMSGWLLMGLPGAIYLTGVGGDGWIAIGLFIGTTLNWLLIATKLRRYTIRANNSVTLPTYFENRFHDEKKVLMTVSSITIVVFFLVYCASALSAGGQLFESVFGIDYHVALTIGALVVLVYTFLGGFTAVCDRLYPGYADAGRYSGSTAVRLSFSDNRRHYIVSRSGSQRCRQCQLPEPDEER